ncbi:uncharacterized protein BJ212DRAFT_1295728 [Suillus subaureus]|uniref:Uncharacterized protein n=1 Tax=Suillus subaureus TaxID=48587 RepID=A0A9P7JIU4_9AGAM|nr:uncharacterized protein BJ212DRAFT_1295728 [Suillus subaureus]KAG1824594.1 hypothetical protein BJ212DRAFT_1295728 [Suillus subaureus]
MTRSGSAASMNIADALAPSATNRLNPAERKAFGKSDHKAAKILGITLTRNHVDQDGRLARVPPADQEDPQVGYTLAEMMALIGAKRARSRNSSAVTVFRPRKGLGLALGMGMDLVEKHRKRRVIGGYTQRVVLGLCSNEPPVKEFEELSTTVNDDGACSFLEPGEIEETETPLADRYIAGNHEEEEEDRLHGSRGFVWDVEDPFATPPNAVLQQYAEAMRLGETIGPLDVPPVASLCHTTNFESLPEGEIRALRLYADDSFDDLFRPAERAYLDFLIARDEAEEQPMERRRQRRAAVRSRSKMLDILGVEARQAVDGQC